MDERKDAGPKTLERSRPRADFLVEMHCSNSLGNIDLYPIGYPPYASPRAGFT